MIVRPSTTASQKWLRGRWVHLFIFQPHESVTFATLFCNTIDKNNTVMLDWKYLLNPLDVEGIVDSRPWNTISDQFASAEVCDASFFSTSEQCKVSNTLSTYM